MSINKNSIFKVSFLIIFNIFLISSLYFSKDLLGIKKLSFFLMVLFSTRIFLKTKFNRNGKKILFFTFFYPILTISVSSLITLDPFKSILLGYSPFILILYFVLIDLKIDLEQYLVFYIQIMAIFLISLVCLDSLQIINLRIISLWINDNDIGSFALDSSFTFYYKLYLRTSILFVIPFFYFLEKKMIVNFLITCLGVIISGSRSNFIAFSIIGILYFFLNNHNKSRLKKQIISIIICIGILVFLLSFDLSSFHNKRSDSIRNEHINMYKEDLGNNIFDLFLGSGYGSLFYNSSIYHKEVFATEYSYLEVLRQNGFIAFIFLFFFLIQPFFKKSSSHFYVKYSYFTFLIVSFANPLLLNSTGFIMLLYVFTKIYNSRSNI